MYKNIYNIISGIYYKYKGLLQNLKKKFLKSNAIYYTNKLKKKNYKFISVDAKKYLTNSNTNL